MLGDSPVRPEELGIGWLFWRIPEGIVGAEIDRGTIVLWNPAAERIFGYTAAEAIGMPIERLVADELRARHLAGLARYRRTGRGRLIEGGKAVEVPGQHRDGHAVYIELTLVPVDEPQRPGRYVVAIIRDVTERRRTEQERQQRLIEESRRAQAETALQTLDAFIDLAAHELKTPITSLRGFAQLLIRQLDVAGRFDSTRVRHALGVIDRQSQRLTRLVEQLLDISRIEAGRLEIRPVETELVGLAGRAAEAVEAASQRSISVQAARPVVAPADPARIEQVLRNLLDNAVRYSPDGGPIEVEVALETERSGPVVRIAVRDHGVGVAPADREAIFDRFHQAPSHAHAGGLGLGLYVSRHILSRHGGRLEAEYPPDGGARFVAVLPNARPGPGPGED